MPPQLSVVIATYNRQALLRALLEDLREQDVGSDAFEVVLVDDGSHAPVRDAIASLSLPYTLTLIAQPNAGQAVARDNGIRRAAGEIVVIVDDDMRLPTHFLRAHREAHAAGCTVVLGWIKPSPTLDHMPLFERFHARQLDAFVAGVRRGERVRGAALCTGNVSVRRADYLAVGGFDRALTRSEDRDLGIRLEAHGARIAFSERAYSTHGSDHNDLTKWRRRARLYGRCDSTIADKHALLEYVDPWHFLFDVNPVSRPLLLLATASPRAGALLAESAMKLSNALERAGVSSLAISGTTLVYGLEYFIGMREHAGSLTGSVRRLRRYLEKRAASNPVEA
jgi:glycosyltransferase involved in cell wall biosynthesis